MAQTTSDPVVGSYEVKFILLATSVLNDSEAPNGDVRSALGIGTGTTDMAMQFLDDERRTLHESGKWNVRVCRSIDTDDEGIVELTYKKRYGAEGPDGINRALKSAAADGFGRGADDSSFECQVEWCLRKRTLTFSLKRTSEAEKLGVGGNGKVDLPNRDRSLEWASKKRPAEFPSDLCDRLSDAPHLYGPVSGKSYRGRWDDRKVGLEVWHILGADGNRLESVVELSFKQNDEPAPGDVADRLMDFLEERDWLVGEDVRKTTLILTRYGTGTR